MNTGHDIPIPILFVGGSSAEGRKWFEDWRVYSSSLVPAMLLPRGSIDFFLAHEKNKFSK